MTRSVAQRSALRITTFVGVCGLVLALLASGTARAHDLRPGVLSLAETERGVYDLRLVPPVDGRGDVVAVELAFPPTCARDGNRVRCEGQLAGTIAVRGMRGASMRTLIELTRQDGRRIEWIASAHAPAIDVRMPQRHTWRMWLRIGVEHILGGPDHLAFVLGLLLVLGLGRGPVLDRRLFAAITAFTAAHSLSLALAVTGVVQLSVAPVEACIAASVVLVAREATHHTPTVTRRLPWLAAAGFGLVHGLGFASALGELGLPRTSLASSLALFNLGVELGQLGVVAAALLVAWVGGRVLGQRAWLRQRIHRATCYALGGLAAWWLAERMVIIAAGSV